MNRKVDFEEVCEHLPVDRRALIEVIRQLEERGEISVVWRGDTPVSFSGGSTRNQPGVV